MARQSRFTEAPFRSEALAEIHARPFAAVTTPRRVIHFAYLVDEAAAADDLAALAAFAAGRGGEVPEAGARHLSMTIAEGRLRWERHTEFTTYSWDMDVAAGGARWSQLPALVPADAPDPPGPLAVAIELLLVASSDDHWSDGDTLDWGFDPASLCVSRVDGAQAIAATDFRAGDDGFTRILVRDLGLGAQRAGVVLRRLIEVETYRTLAMMALPVVRRATPSLDRTELDLVSMLRQTSETGTSVDHKTLLNRLTDSAASLERLKSETSYRLAASEAYEEIVRERLADLGEEPVEGQRTWAIFLNRRLGPALRTCMSFGQRLDSLSRRLDRAADLLRTRVDIALEAQNNAVLRSMNRRSQLQLRLQQTVEGLSVAAVSYYVVGLIAYMAKGGEGIGLPASPAVIAALSVPVVVAIVALIVWRIRRRHVAAGGDPAGRGEPSGVRRHQTADD